MVGVTVALVFDSTTTQSLTVALDTANADVGRAQRHMLHLIVAADRRDIWRGTGARDTAHWLCMRYGISEWKARRWVAAAHALENLPRIAEALASGELGIDKVVELTRFATPETEARLIRWAMTVSVGAVRHRGDLEARARSPTSGRPSGAGRSPGGTSTRDAGSGWRPICPPRPAR